MHTMRMGGFFWDEPARDSKAGNAMEMPAALRKERRDRAEFCWVFMISGGDGAGESCSK